MAFGDLSQFLPRAEGTKLNVAQAQSESSKRANYLSQMDQFYESLEETQRQFDLQQELENMQFSWMSGFEERKFAEEHELDTQRQNYLQTFYQQQLEFQRRQMEMEEEMFRDEFGFDEDDDKYDLYDPWRKGSAWGRRSRRRPWMTQIFSGGRAGRSPVISLADTREGFRE